MPFLAQYCQFASPATAAFCSSVHVSDDVLNAWSSSSQSNRWFMNVIVSANAAVGMRPSSSPG